MKLNTNNDFYLQILIYELKEINDKLDTILTNFIFGDYI